MMRVSMIAVVCLAVIQLVLPQQTKGDVDMIPTDGLVAYYPFNGNADDESGKGHPGKVSGAKLAVDRFGRQRHAYAFDGVDDEIVITPPPGLNARGFTVSLWVQFGLPEEHTPWVDWGDGGPAFRDPVIGQDDGYVIRCFQLWVGPGGGIVWHRMNEHSSVWTKWNVSKDGWYHVAATFGGGEHVLYVDGKKEWGTPGIFKVSYEEPIRIGSKGDELVGRRAFLAGAVDDIRFYTRALTEAEVQALFTERQE